MDNTLFNTQTGFKTGFIEELDTRGLLCPEPVMLLHNKIRGLKSGQVLRVVATDPTTQRDVPNFCRFLEHDLLSCDIQETQFCYIIRKSGRQ